jgi:hypothetical protein
MSDHLPPRELPLKVIQDDEEYYRLQYTFRPASVEQGTVSRSLERDSARRGVGYVSHTLESGNIARFKGLWKDSPQTAQQCTLIFANNEVLLVPLAGSIVQLQKEPT